MQASLIQHGMSADDVTNVEHVADIKELEDLLNDSLAKQRVNICSCCFFCLISISISINNV